MSVIYIGSKDLTSAWQARPDIGRNMPDVTDVSPGQVSQPRRIDYVRRDLVQSTKQEKEHQASVQKYVRYPTSSLMSQKVNAHPDTESKDSLKEPSTSPTTSPPSKEDTNCDDLIYLNGPCTEASIINVLRSRFKKNLFQVFLKSYNSLIFLMSLFIEDMDRTFAGPTVSTQKPNQRL